MYPTSPGWPTHGLNPYQILSRRPQVRKDRIVVAGLGQPREPPSRSHLVFFLLCPTAGGPLGALGRFFHSFFLIRVGHPGVAPRHRRARGHATGQPRLRPVGCPRPWGVVRGNTLQLRRQQRRTRHSLPTTSAKVR